MRRPRIQLQSFFLGLAAIVFVASRLWHLTSYGLFGDEVFTLWTSAQDWRSLFQSVVEDVVHPPLFYALLKVWIDAGGQSLLWIKLLPALLSILSIAPFYLLCRELKTSGWAAGLALWLMAVNGFLIGHGQEPRMYGLLLLLVLLSLWLFVRLQRGDRKSSGILVALTLVNLLMVFTHYFGWVIVAVELVFLIFARRDLVPRFLLSVVSVAVCFSPWVYFVVGAARANPSRATFFWNHPPPWSDLIGYYANLNGPLSYRWKVVGTGVVMLVFITPIVIQCVRSVKTRHHRREVDQFWFLLLFGFAPVAVAFVASHLLPQSVWAFRYLIIAAPAYFLTLAVATERIASTQTRIIVFILVAGWAGVSGFTEMVNRDLIAWEPLVQRMIQAESDDGIDLMRQGTVFSGIPVYVTDPNVGNTIQYYLDKVGETRFRISTVESLLSPAEEHSWAALIRYKHETGPQLEAELEREGYGVDRAIEAQAAGHSAFLLQVEKREWRTRSSK